MQISIVSKIGTEVNNFLIYEHINLLVKLDCCIYFAKENESFMQSLLSCCRLFTTFGKNQRTSYQCNKIHFSCYVHSCKKLSLQFRNKLQHLVYKRSGCSTNSDAVQNILNLSYQLSSFEHAILGHGLEFSIPPSCIKCEEIFFRILNFQRSNSKTSNCF